MIVSTSLATDARVLKEAATLVGAGHTVHVIGKNVPGGFRPPAGVTVSSVGASSVLRPEGAPSLASRKLPAPVRLARWAMLPAHRNSSFRRFGLAAEEIARELEFDVVHAHDFTALAAGARIAARAQVPLIYDTHEFWGGRAREYRPTPVQDARERRVEGHLGAQAAAVITVGDGVADALRRRYAHSGWPPITVVRNSFPPLGPEAALPPLPRKPAGVIYAGRVGAHRELETAAAASTLLRADGLDVTLMGPADPAWLTRLDRGAAELRAPTPPDEVDAHLRRAGLVLVTLAPGWANHELALPNKLFHAVRAGVPVVATDVGELAAVVRRHGIGTLYRAGDPADLVRAVREAVEGYGGLTAAVADAQHELSWAADGAALVGVYDALTGAPPPSTEHMASAGHGGGASVMSRIGNVPAAARGAYRAARGKVGVR